MTTGPSINHANKLLTRISDARQVIRIKHGVWVFPDVEPILLPCILTAPFPAYISLQSALYYHGMISQIPNMIYAISLSRTSTFHTAITDVSIHHVQPSFFFGYEKINNNDLLKIATPEKTLIDIFYLSQTKTRLFATLPEVELPDHFNFAVADRMIEKIKSIRKKSLVMRLFADFIQKR